MAADSDPREDLFAPARSDARVVAGRKLGLPLQYASPPAPGEKRRVLVVDDEPGIRYMARRVLERHFEVLEAGSGEDALALLEREAFHLAVIDVRLPGISGLDLLSAIKGCCPRIDVIVITGSVADPDEALEDAVRRQAFFFLRKPFPMNVLETLAQRAAERQSLEERLYEYLGALEQNLEAARAFQLRLLPPARWSSPRARVASRYVPSVQLSGDFFDYWTLGHGGTAYFIADVMGHGPAAAMVTGIVKSQVRSLSNEFRDPGEVLHALEEELERVRLNRFLTAFLLFDRPEEGELVYAGAGHPAVLCLRPGEPLLELESNGVPLSTGLAIGPRESMAVARRAGTRLLLYTDGYTEARSPEDLGFYESPDETASPFRRAAERALDADSPEAGLAALESGREAHIRGAEEVEDDDRAAVLAWLL